jgi:hypothetical protein
MLRWRAEIQLEVFSDSPNPVLSSWDGTTG